MKALATKNQAEHLVPVLIALLGNAGNRVRIEAVVATNVDNSCPDTHLRARGHNHICSLEALLDIIIKILTPFSRKRSIPIVSALLFLFTGSSKLSTTITTADTHRRSLDQ
jgi:hypothetical protein